MGVMMETKLEQARRIATGLANCPPPYAYFCHSVGGKRWVTRLHNDDAVPSGWSHMTPHSFDGWAA
jgi:hypothetical protein